MSMNIEQAIGIPKGNRTVVKAMVGQCQLAEKKNGDPFLNVVVQDSTGSVSMPVWDAVGKWQDTLREGAVYQMTVQVGDYQGKPQFKLLAASPLEEVNLSDFVPSYEIDDTDIDDLIAIIETMPRPLVEVAYCAIGMDDREHEVARAQAFFSCPASIAHHGNKVGGLFFHTLRMLRLAQALLPMLNLTPEEEGELLLVIIMHDLMKAREYSWTPNIARRPGVLSNHRDMGTSYLEQINRECGGLLADEQLQRCSYAILSHHGQWGEYEPKSKLDRLLHHIDDIEAQTAL